ncbi:DUF975 family protein [Acetilactobacillus jinshanensis]|nr:DUF975 family protein [Acetilactobacillus jinshanensis]URL60521.1 DUF975 family protein [uncultured bacterium]
MNSTRRQLKQHARNMLNPNFGFFAALIFPSFILAFLSSINGNIVFKRVMYSNTSFSVWMGSDSVSTLIDIIGYLLITSVALVCLDLVRGKRSCEHGIEQSTTIFHNGNYFMGALIIGFLRIMWQFFWSLLLIFPGIIKQLAYSQAIYIYKDAVDSGHRMKYWDAITKSRHLMNGHKWELFVIQLSFLGWFIISVLTFSIADFWVQPYYRLTLANFYQKLITDPDNK